MLSLTSSLNPEETGLENIRFNLLVNGAEKSQIPRLTEEIIDFTELGAFMNAPVRTYSSGMNARLSFAISTAIEPDILIVDEVLSAGDAYFATKATLRMIDLCKRGRALLFVSHAMDAIQLLCNTAVWLDGGEIREIGPVDEIARRYEADFRKQEDEVVRPGNAAQRVLRADRVLPAELERTDIARFRLTGPTSRLTDTHYVRKIALSLAGEPVDVELEFSDIDDEGVAACLDVLHSEWGRVHDRQGNLSRALAPSGAALRGGHVLLKRNGSNGAVPVECIVESASLNGGEPLQVQELDVGAGEWVDLETVERLALGSGWERAVFRGMIRPVDEDVHRDRLAKVIEESRPDIEILDVFMLVDGKSALSVRERQPFTIGVRVRGNRPVPRADVMLKLTRSDGAYVFWQSSSQVGVNAEGLVGEATFSFDFDPNLFGAGDYDVTVNLGNGFDVERNFPHSEMYDLRVNALRFTVGREWSLLMLGSLNHRFPVRLERS
jgi:lipopolysaccharide transport system ATP-binding protein